MTRSFQITSIYPKLSVYESVLMGLLSHRRVTLNFFSSARKYFKEEVWRILEDVGLADQANISGDSISHGDKKRLELAITLGTEPELLLLDEPTCGMSPDETETTMIFIKKLAEERGLTILFTEHDMSVVFGIAKRISVLHQGTLIADGKPDEVRANEEVQKVYLGGYRMILEVKEIHTYYGTSHILFGVSLDIQEGEAVCLLGQEWGWEDDDVKKYHWSNGSSFGKYQV